MGLEQRLGHRPSLLGSAHCRDQRVDRDGVVDVVPVAGQRSLHSQGLHSDVGAVESCELERQRTDRGGLDAVVVDQAVAYILGLAKSRDELSPDDYAAAQRSLVGVHVGHSRRRRSRYPAAHVEDRRERMKFPRTPA